MSEPAAVVIIFLFILAWNAALIAGTAYVVFWLGYSGWWWLLTLILIGGSVQSKS
jgi:hypothetical protein